MTDNSTQDTSIAEHEPPPSASPQPEAKWRQRVKKVLWPVHARFPNVIPNPYGDEREYFRTQDREDNAQTSLEDGVEVKLAAFEVSEIFGPNEINSLYEALERLGWDRDRTFSRDSNIAWLRKQRLYGSEGTLPLGYVHRTKDAKKYVGVRYTADFPLQFASMLVDISQVTPSVTCLTVCFVLNDVASLGYEAAINTPQKTTRYPKRGSRSYTIKQVVHMKEDSVERVRNEYRRLGISWVKDNLPGFFSARCEESHFPTAEFIDLKGFTPFDKNESKGRDWKHWARFLNIDNFHDSWVSSSIPALRFSLEPRRGDKLPNHMIVGLRWDALTDENKKHYSEESLGSRTYFARERLGGITSKYVLSCYLSEVIREIKEVRQALGSDIVRKGSSSGMQRISTHFHNSIGNTAIAREVLVLSKNDASFRWNASGFNLQSFHENEDSPFDISSGLKSVLSRLSSSLIDEDRDTREFLSQISSAIGAKESVSAQRRMELVAVIALIVSVCSLLVSLFWD